MKNLENRLVYLTLAGANRLFGSDTHQGVGLGGRNMVGLPVIPTDPTLVSGTIVYGDTFTDFNGEYVGGCNSEDTFTEDRPDEETIQRAQQNYLEHCRQLDERYGRHPKKVETVADPTTLKSKPQTSPIPTLEQRAERRRSGGQW